MSLKKSILAASIAVTMVASVVPGIDVANAKTPSNQDGLYIMLDAGHYGNMNKGLAEGYWESKQMWALTENLYSELQEYPGIVVAKTRESESKDLALYERGYKSENYDFFMSLHSNDSSDKNTDYPLAIVSSRSSYKSYLGGLALSLANTVGNVLETNQGAKLWTRKQSDGQDWYSVIRNAAAVDTPGMILENSFHSNLGVSTWLMKDANLKTLAKAEAKTIANHFNLSKTGSFETPGIATNFDAYGLTADSVKIKWGPAEWASGYYLYRKDGKTGSYKKIATFKDRSETSYIDKNVETNAPYYYKIIAFRDADGKILKGHGTKPNGARPVLQKLGNFDAVGYKQNQVKITWDQVSQASDYEIYRATSAHGDYEKIATVDGPGVTTYIDKTVEYNHPYYYKARAVAEYDGKTYSGKMSSINGARPLVQVPKVSFDATKTTLTVKWQKDTTVDGHILYKKQRDGSYKKLVDIPGSDITNYIVDGLKSGCKYTYKVKSYVTIDGNVVYSKYSSASVGKTSK